MAELTVPMLNFSTLGDLGKTYREAQDRRTLADLGKGLADGTLDYKQAAGQLASTGNINGVVSLLQLGQKQQENAALPAAITAAWDRANTPTAAATPGPTVQNDGNAFPGQVGMDQRLADRSQDFIQDNPGTYMSSGVRSTADQARLYADRANNPNPVAVPGTSRHERGLAVDIGGMSADQRAMLPQYGLGQPVANDPPHVELAASAPSIGAIGQGGPSREQIAALAANPATRPLAIDLLKAKMTGAKFTQETDADGNIWNVNQTTGQKTVALKVGGNGNNFKVVGGRLVRIGSDNTVSDVTPDTLTTKVAGGSFALDKLPQVPLREDGTPDPQAQKQFLEQVDPASRNLVQGIADYRIPIEKVTSLRGNQRQELAKVISQYDPSFDMSQYAARAAMRKSITSGNYSQALNSANLVIQHLDALGKAATALDNSSFTPWNSVVNRAKDATGNPTITAFNTAAGAAASELAKVFKGAGASSLQEIQEWRHNLSQNASPAQTKAMVGMAVKDLLKSRIDTIRAQYGAAMGKPADFTFLTPHSREVLQSLGIDPSEIDSGGSKSGSVSLPPNPQSATQPKAQNTTKSGISWSIE